MLSAELVVVAWPAPEEELEQLVRMQRDETKVTNAYAGAEGSRRRE